MLQITPHRARRSPDSAASADTSYGGRGDTPLSRRIFRLRRRKLYYSQLAKSFFRKKDTNGQRIASMALENECRCLITSGGIAGVGAIRTCADLNLGKRFPQSSSDDRPGRVFAQQIRGDRKAAGVWGRSFQYKKARSSRRQLPIVITLRAEALISISPMQSKLGKCA